MKISLTNVGKRFNRDWIFRHLSWEFIAGKSYAITGPNGSGKSTLLQIIGGAIDNSEGKLEYNLSEGAFIDPMNVYRHLSIAAPYLEVVEEMTAIEFLNFHSQFKPLLAHTDISAILQTIGLEDAANKQIRYYSSGMKQRIKLAQAIFSDVPCVLLDEPCTNLDEEGIKLYHQLAARYCANRLVIVSSNDEVEYSFCTDKIDIVQYKKQAV